jgi:hypothetical protein
MVAIVSDAETLLSFFCGRTDEGNMEVEVGIWVGVGG